MSDEIENFLRKFFSLKGIIDSNNLDTSACVVVNFKKNHGNPVISLSNESIKLLNELNANFWMDTYFHSYDTKRAFPNISNKNLKLLEKESDRRHNEKRDKVFQQCKYEKLSLNQNGLR